MNYYNPFKDQSLVKKTTLVDANGKKSTGYYDTAKQAYAQLLENAQKQNAALADAEIADIGAEAQRSGTGLWSTYQQQMRKAPQQLAALGITGGAAESSVVGAGNNYLQQIAELDRQRKQQEADIQLNRDTNNSNAYQTYMNNLLALDQYNQDYQLQLSQLELQKRQLEQQQRQAEAEMELAWAQFEAANSGKKSGGGSGGGKETGGTTSPNQIAVSAVQEMLTPKDGTKPYTKAEILQQLNDEYEKRTITTEQYNTAKQYLYSGRG